MRTILGILGVAACSIGCSPAGEAPVEAEEWTPVAQTTEELGTTEHCDTAPANAVITGNGMAISGGTYGTSQCSHAYLVDVRSYVWNDEAGVSRASASWQHPPTTQAECANAHVAAFAWDITSSSHVYLGSKSVFGGTWTGAYCLGPYVTAPPTPLIQGHNYRYALSAQQFDSTRHYSALRRVHLTVD